MTIAREEALAFMRLCSEYLKILDPITLKHVAETMENDPSAQIDNKDVEAAADFLQEIVDALRGKKQCICTCHDTGLGCLCPCDCED